MVEDKGLIKRVEDMSVRTFTIAGMPEIDFQRFIKFCERNAKATKIFYVQGKRTGITTSALNSSVHQFMNT